MDKLMTVAAAAKVLGVNVATIRRWVKSGVLKAYTKPGKGRTLFVERAAVDARREFVPFGLGSPGFPPVPMPKRK